MKALLINGSPHERGCTYTALEELARTLEAEGIETEIVQAGARTTHGCIACGKCRQTGKCVFDDVVNETAPKLLEADALVIGAPVYYASPAGGAVAFMDRLFYSTGTRSLTMKVGASVVSCRRGGNTASFDVLNKYFTIAGMPIASSQYWNMVYGGSEIVAGSAVALAVELGETSFLGAMGERFEKTTRAVRGEMLGGILPYCKLLSFTSLLLLFLVGIVSLFAAPSAYTSLRVFLPVCVITASASVGVTGLYFTALLFRNRRAAGAEKQKRNRVYIRTDIANETLP